MGDEALFIVRYLRSFLQFSSQIYLALFYVIIQ